MGHCPKCQKKEELCICNLIHPLENRVYVLILQHPREPDHELGTAHIAHLALLQSTLKIGLSWPNLKSALGPKTALGQKALPSNWAVLYLGSGIQGSQNPSKSQTFQFVSKKGTLLPTPKKLEGLILLDGNWSQAKSLWWRNAWLLKCHRAILTPQKNSLYGNLRKEPRRECLSTIESIAESFVALKENPQVSQELLRLFSALLSKKRNLK